MCTVWPDRTDCLLRAAGAWIYPHPMAPETSRPAPMSAGSSSPTREGRRVEVVTDAARFAALAEPWAALAGTEPLPFCEHWWFTAWWRAFGADADLRVWLAWEGERLVAALPLAAHGGAWRALANVHTPVFRPLAADDDALALVLGAALDAAPGRMHVPALPETGPAVDALRAAYRDRGGWTIARPSHVSPIVDTSGDLAAWRAGSKPRWGAPLDRFRRKMIRENAAEMILVEPPRDLDAELARGFAVEASGWKGRAGTAITARQDTAGFYTEVAHVAHAAGELRLSVLTLDGEAAAFDLCLLRHGRLYLVKTGFDERTRRLAPGLVLRLSVIERCFELGLEAHELLGDDTEWKRKFATSERRHVDLQGYARRPVPAVAYAWRGVARPRLKSLRAAVRAR